MVWDAQLSGFCETGKQKLLSLSFDVELEDSYRSEVWDAGKAASVLGSCQEARNCDQVSTRKNLRLYSDLTVLPETGHVTGQFSVVTFVSDYFVLMAANRASKPLVQRTYCLELAPVSSWTTSVIIRIKTTKTTQEVRTFR